MGLYVGNKGRLSLKRTKVNPYSFVSSDIDETNKRIANIPATFKTGDEVTIYNPLGAPLDLSPITSGTSDNPDGHGVWFGGIYRQSPAVFQRVGSSNAAWDTINTTREAWATPANHGRVLSDILFVSVNELGYGRFFNSFYEALIGDPDDAVPVYSAMAGTGTISLVGGTYDIVGSVEKWDLNNQKDNIDISNIGTAFREQQTTLISGSGTIDVLFSANEGSQFSPKYLYDLVLLSQEGAECELTLSLSTDPEINFQFKALITNSVLNTQADALVAGTISFVTTEEIRLNALGAGEISRGASVDVTPDNQLLTEAGDFLYPILI